MSDVDICNRALALAGARAKITALADDSIEAENCNLIFAKVRNQILSMAPWNFVRKTAYLQLVKAQPGTPENSDNSSAGQWQPYNPPPGWLYEYAYPADCMFMRFITPQAGTQTDTVPIFSTSSMTYFPQGSCPMVFTPAQSQVLPFFEITSVSNSNPCVVTTATAHGMSNGNIAWINGVTGINQINGQYYSITVVSPTSFSIALNTTDLGFYLGGGTVVNQHGTATTQRTVLTSASWAIGTYNKREENLDLWSEDAEQALVNALAAMLVIPLGGDKKLKQMCFEEANLAIAAARAADANEGLVIQENVPDWIRIRDTFTYPEASPYYAPWPSLYPTHGLV